MKTSTDEAPPRYAASIRALLSVIDAVGALIELVTDGGIRRGGDVVKAVALGARAVSLGSD